MDYEAGKMNNTVFPGQHTTTTTVTNTQVNPTIRFDKTYMYTLVGQLKMAEIIISCVSLLIVSLSALAQSDQCTFFETVAISSVWWNTIILVFYVFHIIEKFYKIPWLKVEVISNAAFGAFFFLTALLAIGMIRNLMFFFIVVVGIMLTLIFFYDFYLKLQAMQAEEIAQGSRVVSHVVETEATLPPYRY